MEFILPILAVAVGLALLVLGADQFVDGAAATARRLGVSTLIIGMVVVGFGTSAPELLVSATAALQGNGDLALGNALGSNIANITLVLGATALILPLTVRPDTLRREYPLLLGATAVTWLLIRDGALSLLDGLLLVTLLVVIMGALTTLALRRTTADHNADEGIDPRPPAPPLRTALLRLMVGLVVLLIGSRLLVWGAVTTAAHLGVSDVIIGLTLVAVGTSLPELAAAIAGALKNEADLAIGNVIGSNLFNTLAVVAVPGFFGGLAIPADILTRDFALAAALTVALAVLCGGWRPRPRLGRMNGLLLLAVFFGYQLTLYLNA